MTEQSTALKSWEDSKAEVKRLETELSRAKELEDNHRQALVKMLLPKGGYVIAGDRYGIWVDNTLLMLDVSLPSQESRLYIRERRK